MPDPESKVTEEIPSAPEPELEITEEIPSESEPVFEPEIEQEPEQEALVVEPKHPDSENNNPEPVTIKFQYAGKAVSLSDIIDRAKEACGDKAVDLNIYIKPEENRVYFVSGNYTGNFEM